MADLEDEVRRGLAASTAPVAQRRPGVVETAAQKGTLKKTKVGVVIAVTKEPKVGGYLDGGAVLANQVHSHLKNYPDVELIALCGPDSGKWAPESFKLVEKAGWKPLKVELPVQVKDIGDEHGKYLKEELPKSGCCGPAELIKLEAFRLTQYERVIMLDTDTLILHNLDELFEDKEHHAIWTVDRNLGGNCINGGWIVLTPMQAVYDELVATVKKGDFREGSAWGGSNIGWCYGGQTIQGIIPYYFQKLHKPEGAWREADSCIYNNMGDNTNHDGRKQDEVEPKEVKTFHFTVCQKPWDYCDFEGKPICMALHKKWWAARWNLETKRGLPHSDRCDAGRYPPLRIYG